MICGLETQTFAKCFVEYDEAVRQSTVQTVCFNTHRADAPPGAIIYNLENIPLQVPDYATRWAGREVWDFSSTNAAKYGATHVPVGYHPSMERFKRAKDLDIDVIFSGAINDRRAKVLNAIQAMGLKVVVVPTRLYGRGRDALLARAKLALNMLFYEDGVFPALRVAHLVANHVPVLSEDASEGWGFNRSAYANIAEDAMILLRGRQSALDDYAEEAYEEFKAKPMVLPS